MDDTDCREILRASLGIPFLGDSSTHAEMLAVLAAQMFVLKLVRARSEQGPIRQALWNRVKGIERVLNVRI